MGERTWRDESVLVINNNHADSASIRHPVGLVDERALPSLIGSPQNLEKRGDLINAS